MDTKNLTDDALNRLIHTRVLGLECYHSEDRSAYVGRITPVRGQRRCKYCGSTDVSFGILGSMDYCNDLNLAARAEAMVIEKYGIAELNEALATVVLGSSDAYRVPFAPARTRCEAMAAVMEEE